MQYFFTRRTYNATKGQFTNNPATLTRHVGLDALTGGASRGHILPSDKWAKEVLNNGQHKRVIIFVHGFNTDQGEMLKRLRDIRKGVEKQGFDGAVVGFDWPSAGTASLSHYKSDRTNAKAVARHLVLDGIKVLMKFSPLLKVHILAHSMGAFLTLRGLAEVGNSVSPGGSTAYVDQAMFAAADVNQHWMERGAWGGLVMEQRTTGFTNYYSDDDLILDFSGQAVNALTKRAGKHGIRPNLPSNVADVSCTDRYKTFVPRRRDRTSSRSHGWYFDDTQFYKDVVATMNGATPVSTREPIANGDQRLRP